MNSSSQGFSLANPQSDSLMLWLQLVGKQKGYYEIYSISDGYDYTINVAYDIYISNITGYDPDYSNKLATNPALF